RDLIERSDQALIQDSFNRELDRLSHRLLNLVPLPSDSLNTSLEPRRNLLLRALPKRHQRRTNPTRPPLAHVVRRPPHMRANLFAELPNIGRRILPEPAPPIRRERRQRPRAQRLELRRDPARVVLDRLYQPARILAGILHPARPALTELRKIGLDQTTPRLPSSISRLPNILVQRIVLFLNPSEPGGPKLSNILRSLLHLLPVAFP